VQANPILGIHTVQNGAQNSRQLRQHGPVPVLLDDLLAPNPMRMVVQTIAPEQRRLETVQIGRVRYETPPGVCFKARRPKTGDDGQIVPPAASRQLPKRRCLS
jgi:hypothetical protein